MKYVLKRAISMRFFAGKMQISLKKVNKIEEVLFNINFKIIPFFDILTIVGIFFIKNLGCFVFF